LNDAQAVQGLNNLQISFWKQWKRIFSRLSTISD
jgi:hypothetical protein